MKILVEWKSIAKYSDELTNTFYFLSDGKDIWCGSPEDGKATHFLQIYDKLPLPQQEKHFDASIHKIAELIDEDNLSLAEKLVSRMVVELDDQFEDHKETPWGGDIVRMNTMIWLLDEEERPLKPIEKESETYQGWLPVSETIRAQLDGDVSEYQLVEYLDEKEENGE